MTINNERLAKFEGKCWHEVEQGSIKCKHCEKLGTFPWSLSINFSTSPEDRERLWLYLMGKEEMWNSFLDWSVKQYWIKADRGFFPWLTLPLDGVPRWVSLLSDWLGLESVREKWGWVECPCPPEFKGDEEIKRVCPYCSGSGRIRAEWAKEE